MRFMAVQGIGYWVQTGSSRSIHIVVTGDDRRRVETIRDETVPALTGPHVDDLDWQVDQYTQESIGVTLAAAGWEVFSTSERDELDNGALTSSPVYLVRQA